MISLQFYATPCILYFIKSHKYLFYFGRVIQRKDKIHTADIFLFFLIVTFEPYHFKYCCLSDITNLDKFRITSIKHIGIFLWYFLWKYRFLDEYFREKEKYCSFCNYSQFKVNFNWFHVTALVKYLSIIPNKY